MFDSYKSRSSISDKVYVYRKSLWVLSLRAIDVEGVLRGSIGHVIHINSYFRLENEKRNKIGSNSEMD